MKAPHSALLLSALACTAAAAPPAPTSFIASRGGNLGDPVSAENYVYLPTGSTLTAWNRLSDGAVQLVGDTRSTPADGWLTGLVRQGDYLYASYRGYSAEAAGVAVYSIADRAHPQLLGLYDNYSNAAIRMPESIAIANGYLYLLDSEQGIFASPLASPALPAFSRVSTDWGSYDHATVQGNRLYTVGRTFLSGTALNIYDLTTPLAPQLLGATTLDGYDNFRLKVRAPYAYGFGLAMNITDIGDPANILPRGRIDTPVAYEGLLLGDHAWGVGLDGLDVWNVANPDQPAQAGHFTIGTFATDATAVLGEDALLATRADRFVRLDATLPTTPTQRSESQLPAGTAAYDLSVRGDTALVLGNAYGLNIAKAGDLAPLGRYETSLEPSLQGRAFEQLALDGNRAYLTSWGSGLVIADIANPRQPQELGFWPYGFATAVVARGNFAYVGRSTNGGELVVVDVSNPAQPQPRGSLASSKILRLALHGNHVFIADEAVDGPGSLILVDISNPDAPVETSRYTGCNSVSDVAVDPSGRRALIACGEFAHLVDVSNRAQPVLLGIYTDGGRTVALRGDRAFIGSDFTLDEVDLANPAQPQRLQRWNLAAPAMRVQAAADGRVYAMTGLAGVYVFEPDRIFADTQQ
ncbi:hypothetical protein DFR29_1013 [Tahibacter aquaticus]|uniref:LVIVD repeat-containing protein n=1 Tax=Tahibacter aquaticus TaxID=520092 RepID=A0A4R6Z950_9GAMM|nr:hypothetical protein [Tahibacter aquaticus]TDR48385.1 hypothetical protein DFR29_1013 [Tahibacter aquaticus]